MLTHHLKYAVAVIAAVVVTSGLSAQTTFNYNFNSGQADFESSFSRNGFSGSGSFYYYSAGGLSDSGRIQADGSSSDSAIYNTALLNSGTISISAFFKTAPTLASGDVFGLGLYLNPSTQTNSGGNSVGFVQVTGLSSGLTADSWFLLSTSFTNTGSTYSVTSTLQPYDAFGNSTGSAFTFVTGNFGAAGLAAASTVYAGIYGGTAGGNAQGARAIDNFSVTGTSAIPEPSTYAAIFGAAALGLAVWRRKSVAVKRVA